MHIGPTAHPLRVTFIAIAACGLVACGGKPAPQATSPEPAAPVADERGRSVASIIDLMKHEIDPSADVLWEAVASVATTEGMVDRKPSTDAEWDVLRAHAVRLAESANLLMLPGRQIAHAGQRLDDEGVAGNFTQAQAQAALDTEHTAFVAFARALQEQSIELVKAIEGRDVDAYLEAGGHLDEACEACHQHFWYPGGGAPPVAAR
jgi:hypothetical protein